MPENTGIKVSSVCLQIMSNKQILIENYRKLILYTNNEIIVDAKDCRVKILGNSLFIDFYSRYEMIINGTICEVIFV